MKFEDAEWLVKIEDYLAEAIGRVLSPKQYPEQYNVVMQIIITVLDKCTDDTIQFVRKEECAKAIINEFTVRIGHVATLTLFYDKVLTEINNTVDEKTAKELEELTFPHFEKAMSDMESNREGI